VPVLRYKFESLLSVGDFKLLDRPSISRHLRTGSCLTDA